MHWQGSRRHQALAQAVAGESASVLVGKLALGSEKELARGLIGESVLVEELALG